MADVTQSQVINIVDVELQQVQAELGNSPMYSFEWLDAEIKANQIFNHCQYLKLTLLTEEIKPQTPKLVIFGDLNWSALFNFCLYASEKGITLVAVRFTKPAPQLTGALEFYLSKPLSDAVRHDILEQAEHLGIECCYLASGPVLSEPGLLVMDMDSTAIEIECIDEIAALAGVGEQVAKVTAAAMRGELDFAESLKARVKTLTGAPVSIIDQVADNLPLMPGLTDLVSQLQQRNWKIAIASGGFTYMTDVLKDQLNLDAIRANQLGMADGKLTGEVLGDIVDAEVKASTVKQLAQQFSIPLTQTVAMGDGANDLKMMAAAQLGVAFHAKPLVRKEADVSVRQGGLDQLLYLL